MSRILVVADDPRAIMTSEVRWWRHHLRLNKDYYWYIQQVYLPEGIENAKPWGGDIEYFDGRDDWSFPFKVQLWSIPHWANHIEDYPIAPPVTRYLDILAYQPPNTLGWRPITMPGDTRHPGDKPRLDDTPRFFDAY